MHPIAHAQTRPDHPAIIMAPSGETVTFGQMDDYANRFAQLLRSRGLKRGDHFAVLMENNSHYLQVVWGSQRAGRVGGPLCSSPASPGRDARLLNRHRRSPASSPPASTGTRRKSEETVRKGKPSVRSGWRQC